MTLAPLHPTHARETTPIGTGLDFERAVRMCPRCGAVLDAPCVTAAGKPTRSHVGRWGR